MKAATGAIGNKLKQEVTGSIKTTGQKINWEDLNYPPYFNLIHYDILEVPEPQRKLMQFTNYYFISQVGFFLLNFLNALVQVISGYTWKRLLASVLYYFIIISISAAFFYFSFETTVGIEPSRVYYKIAAGVLVLLFFVQMIFDTICWNGIARVFHMFADGKAIAALFAIVDLLAVLVQWVFLGLLGYMHSQAERGQKSVL